MSDAVTQSDANEHPMVRVVRYVFDTMPAEFRQILDGVARRGDTEAVRALHGAGLLDERTAKTAVLPLPLFATDRQVATQLIREVVSSDGQPTPAQMLEHFRNADTPGGIRALVALGGDPNWLDESEGPAITTPLFRQFSKAESSGKEKRKTQLLVVMEILDILAERDVVPLMEHYSKDGAITQRNFFDCAAFFAVDGGIQSAYPEVMSQLFEKQWPESWRRAAAAAILDAARTGAGPWDSHLQLTLMAELMSKAKFDDAAAWRGLFQDSPNPQGIVASMPNWLADNGFGGPAGVAAVENIIAHGVAIDDIPVELHTEDDPDSVIARGTLLHSALMAQNGPMVEALLNGGASPDAPVLDFSDRLIPCIAFAEEYFPDALPLLHVRRAKDAIARTLEQAAAAGRTVTARGAL